MERVVSLFNGRHDFASFTPKSGLGDEEVVVDTVKNIERFELKKSDEFALMNDQNVDSNISLWVFYVKSKSFLYNQVSHVIQIVLFSYMSECLLSH